MQDGSKLAMMFEQRDAVFGDAVDRRSRTVNTMTDADVSGIQQPFHPPVEAVPGVIEAPQLHQFKQLMVADKLRVAHLAEQRNVSFGIDDQTAFGIAHSKLVSLRRPLRPVAKMLRLADSAARLSARARARCGPNLPVPSGAILLVYLAAD